MDKNPKRLVWVAVFGALVTAGILAAVAYDPQKPAIEDAFKGFVGDLRTRNMDSVARRYLPSDLILLKNSALMLASDSSSFRGALLNGLRVRDVHELAAVSGEQFFGFLVDKTYPQQFEVYRAAADAHLVGIEVARDGDDANVVGVLALSRPEGMRHIHIEVRMSQKEGNW